MKKFTKVLSFLLALMMVLSLAACGGGDNTTGSTDSGNQGGNAVYSVKVADVLGNPYTAGIVVLFLQNGEQVAMQPVNAEGVASKELPKGEYEVKLQINKNPENYHYSTTDVKLTAETTTATVVLSGVAGPDYEIISVNGAERRLYKLVVDAAAGTFTLEDFLGELDGTYKFTYNEDDDLYEVTDNAGEDVGMMITPNLDGSFSFRCGNMTFGQQMVQEGDATEELNGTYYVESNQFQAYYVAPGCTYLELNTTERNYVIFTPTQSGIYQLTVHNATATIGYYGSPYFVQSENSGIDAGEGSIKVEIKDGMIGTDNSGTSQLVIGIDSTDTSCILSLVRVADYVPTPEELPWSSYETSFVPTKYTVPAGVTLKDFDLTASYNLVFNETDGYYHLNSENGPVVLVRLYSALSYGGSFGDILANTNVGAYFYDEDGNFLRKELYNDCLLSYLGTLNKGMGSYSYSGGMMDATHGVYPLTKDLEYIIKTYGARMGWWDATQNGYLFQTLPNLNVDSAWLFMCCYAE